MQLRLLKTAVLALMFLGCFAPGITLSQRVDLSVPQEFIVKFKKGTSASKKQLLKSRMRVKKAKPLKLIDAQVISTSEFDYSELKKLLAAGEIEYIEPNYIYTIDTTPNDSRFNELWGMHNNQQTGGSDNIDIDAPEAWNITTGSSSVVVGVIDTGVNYNHPDLAANIWVNPGEIPGNGLDDDSNGYVDDVRGWNSITDSGNANDDNGHGSHCAGTIAGIGDNGVGVAGVTWNVKILPLKFLSASGSGSTADAIELIDYAVTLKNRGVNLRVLSNSWGGSGQSAALGEAIERANAAGILFTAAAGNSASDNDSDPHYPSSYDSANVLSVAAIDHDGNIASFSNYGANSVDVAAPGVNILSTVLGSNYSSYSGTSMATPHVSGVAALVLSHEPGLSPSEVKSRLINTIKPLTALNGQMVAPGTVSAYNALMNISVPLPPAAPRTKYDNWLSDFSPESNIGERILNVDDGYAEVNLGFTFRFYRGEFTRLAVSSNGRVVPLRSTDEMPSTADFSNRMFPGINVYNDDLFPLATPDGGVWLARTPSGIAITWNMVSYSHRTSQLPEQAVRFQLKIFDSGEIQFHFIDTETGFEALNYGTSATSGLAPVHGVSGEPLMLTNNMTAPTIVGSGTAITMRVKNSSRKGDIDGDKAADLISYDRRLGQWRILLSSSQFNPDAPLVIDNGRRGGIPVVGDIEGDQKVDLGVYRDGLWEIRGSVQGFAHVKRFRWGSEGDIPLLADYDGDTLADLALYRPGERSFYVLLSSKKFDTRRARKGDKNVFKVIKIGGNEYEPVIGDFTGSGNQSVAVVHKRSRVWSGRQMNGSRLQSVKFGQRGDQTLACDLDSNGIDDRVAVRVGPDNSLTWNVRRSDGIEYSESFGMKGDIPRCQYDYDGDGQADLAVFRPSTGQWLLRNSSTGLKALSAKRKVTPL